MRKSRHCTRRKPPTTFGKASSELSRTLTSSRGQRRKDRAWAKRLQARPLFAHYAIDDDSERTDVLIATPTPKNPPDWAM